MSYESLGDQNHDEVLRFGDLELRREQGVVTKAGEELSLTRTEFRMLCEFAEHADAVLSRDQLLDHVWGYEYLGDSRLVDAHVRRLRLKIEDTPDDPQRIVTVRVWVTGSFRSDYFAAGFQAGNRFSTKAMPSAASGPEKNSSLRARISVNPVRDQALAPVGALLLSQ